MIENERIEPLIQKYSSLLKARGPAAREETALRLKFAEGLTYREIGKVMNLGETEVKEILLRAMKCPPERALLLLFIHGELDSVETQKIAAHIETEEKVRKEFEAVLAMSDEIEQKYSKPAGQDLPAQPPKEVMSKPTEETPDTNKGSRKPFYIAGGVLVAALTAGLIILKSGPSSEDIPAPAEFSAEAPPADPALEEHIAAGQPADVPPPAEEMPPNPEAATDEGAAAAAPGEPAPETAPPVAAVAPAPAPVAEPIPAPSKAKADKKADAKPDKKATKKMAVISAKTKTSNGLNRKKVLAHLQSQLDGKKNSWSDKLAKAKTMQAVMVVNKDGSVGKITTTPKSADTAKFLKEKFNGKPAAFKSKTGGKITLQLKSI